MPMPSSAPPASDMIVRTSAKSRLIRPGSVIRSDTPCTPWRSTSSATRNASIIEVCLSSTDSRRLLGTVIRVSTSAPSASMPCSAAFIRREPSNPNGFVTMPTVSAPSSRAIRATTGAAPVPGAAALAGGDEHHVRALEQRLDAVVVLHRGVVAEVGIRPGPEPARDVGAELQRHVCVGRVQRLRVGVERDELDAGHLGLDHAVDGVDAGPADADHAQLGLARQVARGRCPLVLARRRLPWRRHDVVRQIRGERVPQALLRRRGARRRRALLHLLLLRLLLRRLGLGRRRRGVPGLLTLLRAPEER